MTTPVQLRDVARVDCQLLLTDGEPKVFADVRKASQQRT